MHARTKLTSGLTPAPPYLNRLDHLLEVGDVAEPSVEPIEEGRAAGPDDGAAAELREQSVVEAERLHPRIARRADSAASASQFDTPSPRRAGSRRICSRRSRRCRRARGCRQRPRSAGDWSVLAPADPLLPCSRPVYPISTAGSVPRSPKPRPTTKSLRYGEMSSLSACHPRLTPNLRPVHRPNGEHPTSAGRSTSAASFSHDDDAPLTTKRHRSTPWPQFGSAARNPGRIRPH